MTEIKRINRLFSSESMFLKRMLYIPVMGGEEVGQPLDSIYRPSSRGTSSATTPMGNSEMSNSVSSDSGIVSHNEISLTPINSSRSVQSLTQSLNLSGQNNPREMSLMSPSTSSGYGRENSSHNMFVSAEMHTENYDDIFSRIDKNLKSSRKQMRKIGKQSV